MNVGRWRHTSIILGDQLYVFSGLLYSNPKQQDMKLSRLLDPIGPATTERLDLKRSKQGWSIVPIKVPQAISLVFRGNLKTGITLFGGYAL